MSKKEDFIPGIYNYCDRWCERCSITQHCHLFADLDKAGLFADEEDEDEDDTDELFSDNIRESINFFDEMEDESDFSTEDWDDEEEDRKRENMKETVNNHPLNKVSKEYGMSVHEWSNNATIFYENISEGSNVSDSFENKTEAVEKIKDAFEVIMWYHFLINVKIQRALLGKLEDEDAPHEFYIDDATGSAHVALIGIGRSLKAWQTIKNHIPAFEMESILYTAILEELQESLLKEFPGCDTFISYFV